MPKKKRPKIISFLNQKGGVGKTTLATNIAHYFQTMGIKTLLVDGDPQRSARNWHEANNAELVPCIGLDSETLPADLKSIYDGYEMVIIDGAPQLGKLSAAAIRISDVVFIPVQPSPYDVWATCELVSLIKQRLEITNGSPWAFFIISRAIKNTNLSKEVETALSEYGFGTLISKTTQLVSYAETAAKGKTVLMKKGPAANEIRAIGEEIILICQKINIYLN